MSYEQLDDAGFWFQVVTGKEGFFSYGAKELQFEVYWGGLTST